MPDPRPIIEDLPAWRAAAAAPELVSAAADALAAGPAAIQRLRLAAGDDRIAQAALALAAGRKRAAAKFGPEPNNAARRLVADEQGVEMASSPAAARWKAARYRARLGHAAPVLDLCCGIGGDSVALADAGLAVTPVDLQPVRAWMAARNARRPARVADAVTLAADNARRAREAVHLDPQRRAGAGRRIARLADLSPGVDHIQEILLRRPDAGVKLMPGVNRSQLADAGLVGELEVISEHGRLTQAVLWSGALRSAAPARATLLRSGARPLTIAGDPDARSAASHSGTGGTMRFVFEIDDAVERAGIVGLLAQRTGLGVVHPRLGLLTGDAPPRMPCAGFLRGFEVLADEPYKPRRLRRTLAALDAGVVDVKTRGGAVDPDRLAPALRGSGDTTLTVFVLRFDRSLRAIVTRRGVAGGRGDAED